MLPAKLCQRVFEVYVDIVEALLMRIFSYRTQRVKIRFVVLPSRNTTGSLVMITYAWSTCFFRIIFNITLFSVTNQSDSSCSFDIIGDCFF